MWEKVAQMPLFDLFFLVGLAVDWEFDGFNNIYSSMCFPTQQNLVYLLESAACVGNSGCDLIGYL